MASKATSCSENRVDFLPYELGYIPDDLRKRAKFELYEDEDTRIQSLKLLRCMLEEETDLRWQDEELFLLAFLRARKFDVKRAFQLMKTFYSVMGKHDELYHDFNFADVKKTIENKILGFLPYRDCEGSVIFVMRTSTWNPHISSLGDIIRALTCALFHANLSPATQIAGFKGIVDFSGLTLKHLPHVSPTYLSLIAEALQNCFPGRFRALHVVNEDHIFSYIWIIIKPFLKKKIKERFHFHGKNMKELHKYFCPSILPAEYEGELPPFDNTEWGLKVEEKAEYLTYVFSHGYQKCKAKVQERKKN